MPFWGLPSSVQKLDPVYAARLDPDVTPGRPRQYENDEARAERRLDMVLRWKPESQVWALKYGALGLGVFSSLTALPISRHNRRLLRVRHKGIILQFITCILIPSVSGGAFQFLAITRHLLASRYPPCPVCWELRSGVTQFATGVFFPAVLSPIVSSMLANLYKTEAVPPLGTDNVRNIAKFQRGLISGLWTKLGVLTCLQFIAGMVVVRFMFEQLKSVRQREAEMEETGTFAVYRDDIGGLGAGVTVGPDGTPTKYIVRKFHGHQKSEK